MSNGRVNHVVLQLRKLAGADYNGSLPDRVLLERFVQERDEIAFAALVDRHGPMVLGVCRRVLRNAHDAEDACQAAFLVFVRKAASIRKAHSVASWLHGVAFRAAANLKRKVSRQPECASTIDEVPQKETWDPTWSEVRQMLDDEVQRLPPRLQAPVLLCCLEGKTRDEAAEALGWRLSTLRGRLERGRELLRSRLSRRGLSLSGALLTSLLTQNTSTAALPSALLARIAHSAMLEAAGSISTTGILSTRVAALTEGVLRTMWLSKLRYTTILLLSLSFIGLGGAVITRSSLVWSQAEGADADPQSKTAGGERPATRRPTERAADTAQLPRLLAESRLNLKRLALAMHNYHDAFGQFPAPAIYSGQVQLQQGNAARAVFSDPFQSFPGAAGPGMMPSSGNVLKERNFQLPGPGDPGMMTRGGGMPMSGPGPGPVVGMSAPVIVAKGEKALLSWRVAILPYLDENELFAQFKLDEAWDSPHNKQLLKRMPKIFAPPGTKTREPYATFYQVFVGPHAAFEKHRARRVTDIIDGLSNTIMMVEAANAVPWTKPEDLNFAPDEPIPELGGLFAGLCNAAFMDGAVHTLASNGPADILRLAIMCDDGMPADFNRIKAPGGRRERELREQNETLRQELDSEKSRLEILMREKEVLQEMVDDTATRQLKEENEELKQQIRKAQEEAERLQQEIQRLKQTPSKRTKE